MQIYLCRSARYTPGKFSNACGPVDPCFCFFPTSGASSRTCHDTQPQLHRFLPEIRLLAFTVTSSPLASANLCCSLPLARCRQPDLSSPSSSETTPRGYKTCRRIPSVADHASARHACHVALVRSAATAKCPAGIASSGTSPVPTVARRPPNYRPRSLSTKPPRRSSRRSHRPLLRHHTPTPKGIHRIHPILSIRLPQLAMNQIWIPRRSSTSRRPSGMRSITRWSLWNRFSEACIHSSRHTRPGNEPTIRAWSGRNPSGRRVSTGRTC